MSTIKPSAGELLRRQRAFQKGIEARVAVDLTGETAWCPFTAARYASAWHRGFHHRRAA